MLEPDETGLFGSRSCTHHGRGLTPHQLELLPRQPGTLVLEFASRTVTIEGIRLEALMTEVMNRHLAMVRANDNPAFEAAGREPVIRNVKVEKPQ